MFGQNLQAQNTETPSSSTDSSVLNPEMMDMSQPPELVIVTDADEALNTEMIRVAEFYTDFMWAVYCGTGEQNIRKSKAAYDALIKEYGLNSDSSAASDKVVSSRNISFVYTERSTLRFNTLQNIKGAEDDVRKAIELDPENVSATWLLAQILTRRVFSSIQENRRDAHAQALQEEMLAVLKRVIELDPDHDRAHFYLGTMARDLGQTELAITSFKALTRIMPFDDQFHKELGELYEMENRLEEALQSYERVITILPGQLSTRNRLGQLYLQTGDYSAAIKTFLAILTRLETQTSKRTQVNSIGQTRARAVVEAGEAEIEAHQGISLAYQGQGNFEKSEFHLMRAISLLEEHTRSIRSGTRRARGADRIALTRRIQEAHHTLGQIYLRFNMPRKAVDTFAKILSTDANHIRALAGIGMAYQMLDDLERAEVYFRKAIELSSRNELPDVYNALGYLYAQQGVRLDEAAKLVQRALKSSPTSGAYLDSLGFIYFKQGKLNAAIEYLELANQYLPDTPEILLHLAEVYLQKGLEEKALQALERAIQLEPDNTELRQKLDAVQAGR